MNGWVKGIITGVVLMALPAAVQAGTLGYAVQSNGNHHLYQVDLGTGATVDLGALDFTDAEGLAFAGGSLYAIGGSTPEFWNVTTAPGFKVGDTGARSRVDAGLDYNPVSGMMYNIQGDSGGSTLYEISLATGAASLIGSSGYFGDNLAISSGGQAYAVDGIFADSLYSVDLSTGALSLVGSLGLGEISVQFGLSFDPSSGTLYGLSGNGGIYTLDTTTGAATFVASTLSGFEGLAIPGSGSPMVPAPGAVLLGSLGAGLVSWLRKRRSL